MDYVQHYFFYSVFQMKFGLPIVRMNLFRRIPFLREIGGDRGYYLVRKS